MARRPGKPRSSPRASSKPKLRSERNLSPGEVRDPDSLSGWAWAEPKKQKPRPKAKRLPALPPEECVAKGAAWLDIVSPSWYRQIDGDHVDVCGKGSVHPLDGSFRDDMGRPSFVLGIHRLCKMIPVEVKPQSSLLSGPLSLASQDRRPPQQSYKALDPHRLWDHGFLARPGSEDPVRQILILNACWKAEIAKRIDSIVRIPSP